MTEHTKKHDEFVNNPIGDKSVEEIPGIGETVGQRLTEKGISKAQHVVGEFLAYNRDEQKFKEFIMAYGANAGQADSAYQAVKGYYDNMMNK